MYAIRSKEGKFWQKGTCGNPQWVDTLTALCLHNTRNEAESTLVYINDRPAFADQVYGKEPQHDPKIVEVDCSII